MILRLYVFPYQLATYYLYIFFLCGYGFCLSESTIKEKILPQEKQKN